MLSQGLIVRICRFFAFFGGTDPENCPSDRIMLHTIVLLDFSQELSCFAAVTGHQVRINFFFVCTCLSCSFESSYVLNVFSSLFKVTFLDDRFVIFRLLLI